MAIWGWVFVIFAAILAVISLATPESAQGASVVNLGLIAARQEALTAATAFFLAGIILIAAGSIRAEMTSQRMSRAPEISALSTPPQRNAHYQYGTKVKHSDFGEGTVTGQSGGLVSVHFGPRGDHDVSPASLSLG